MLPMDPPYDNPVEREIEQAITVMKKGAYLLKLGRRGIPKLCHFIVPDDESVLLWSYKNKMKQIILREVFQMEFNKGTDGEKLPSFAIHSKSKSIDLVFNDRKEASVWFVGLHELVTFGNDRKRMRDSVSTSVHSQASGLDNMNGHIKNNARASLSSDVSSSSQYFAHGNGEASGKDENYANLVGNNSNYVGCPTPKPQMRARLTSNPQKEKITIARKESGKCKID